MAIKELKAAEFEAEVLQAAQPVVVDFWATWCGPCRMLSPIVDRVSEQLPEIKTMKCNVDEEGSLAQQFGINAIPCLIRWENGKETDRMVGFAPEAEVKAFFAGK